VGPLCVLVRVSVVNHPFSSELHVPPLIFVFLT
jgi:hypothetical protein